jgi:MbtH protein
MSEADEIPENQTFIVLINDEEQYSIWQKHWKIPNGWRIVGPEGTKEACCRYVDEVWTDMRPLSLRKATEASQN